MKFILDTNTVSFLLRRQGNIARHLQKYSPHDIAISCITEAELLYGIAKNPQSQLINAVHSFLDAVNVLPWDRNAANQYATLKAALIKQGRSIAELDLLIVSHAMALLLTLVTHDKGILQLQDRVEAHLNLEDWY